MRDVRRNAWFGYHTPKRIGQQLLQVQLLDGLAVERVLEVGPHLGLVTALLDNAGYAVTTLDLGPLASKSEIAHADSYRCSCMGTASRLVAVVVHSLLRLPFFGSAASPSITIEHASSGQRGRRRLLSSEIMPPGAATFPSRLLKNSLLRWQYSCDSCR
jgi:hypothetical protein